jgi:hypothetical protein
MEPDELKEKLEDLLDRVKSAAHEAEEAMESIGAVQQDLEDFLNEVFACNKIVEDPSAQLPQRCILKKDHSEPCMSRYQTLRLKLHQMQEDLKAKGIDITPQKPEDPK